MIRRLVSAVVLAGVAMVAVGVSASAHIDPDPKQAQAGSRLTVGFTVEHGCDGSPTVRLDMRLPDGVTDAAAETVENWTGSVETTSEGTVVSFVGGPLADDVEGTFDVTMTLPPTPDTTIYFPFVQRCEVGEIRWIGIPQQPGDELDEPAPAMTLTGPVATVPPTSAPAASAPSTNAPETTQPITTEPSTPAITDAASDTTAPATIPVASEPVASSSGSVGGNSTGGTIAFFLTMTVVFALGAYVVYRARKTKAAADAANAGSGSEAAPGSAD